MDVISIYAIFVSFIMFFVYLPGIYFLIGKGGITVAGYHFEPKNKKAMVHHKYIMRRLGIWYLLLIALLHSCTLCGMFKQMIACYILLGILIIHSILGLIWFNKNKKIKRARYLEKKLNENPDYNELTDDNKI